MGDRKPPSKLEALLALLSTLVMAWCVMPPQERYWIKLGVMRKLHQLATRLAYKTGHLGMGDELAGLDLQRYPVAYQLSRVRDYLARELEQMRP